MAPDYYHTLGVDPDASEEAIKQAFRALAREHHPDVSSDPESESRFQEVSEAYAVLADEGSRRLYDRLGFRGRGRGFSPRRGMARTYARDPRAFLEDIESVLAAAAGRRTAKEPSNVVAEVELDAYEAHLGATRRLDLGFASTCAACEGSGHRKVVSHLEAARFVALEDCQDCKGVGEVHAERAVDLTIPPRSRNLDRISLGAEEVVVVRIVRPRDKLVIRIAAFIAFLAAFAFVLYLLAL